MYQVAVCDDNENDRRSTAETVLRLLGSDRAEVECFSSPEELLAVMDRSGYLPEIAVLDIETGSEMDGITLGRQLNQRVPGCAVIFLSGYDSYMSDVYSAEHIYFINKLQVEKYLPAALDKAKQHLQNNITVVPVLAFDIHDAHYNVPIDDVMYLERMLRKTMIVTGDREYTVRTPPSVLVEQSGSDRFINCHQSFWVNFSYITELTTQEITLRNGQKIPVSRSRSQETKSTYFALLGKSVQHH